jgi:AAHS family 4-hydroxybenzoate transporter-like MFS transporter
VQQIESENEMANERVDVGEIIDSASFLGKPLGIALMMIVIMLTDGFDLFIPSYVAPALVQDWSVSKAAIQPFVQAGLIGMAIGSNELCDSGVLLGSRRARSGPTPYIRGVQ